MSISITAAGINKTITWLKLITLNISLILTWKGFLGHMRTITIHTIKAPNVNTSILRGPEQAAAGIVALGREGFDVVVVGGFNVCSVNFKTFSTI